MGPLEVTVHPHPLLDLGSIVATLPLGVGRLAAPGWLVDLLRLEAETPLARDEEVRQAVRDLFRHGGYKPTGRGKPASEYLVKAVGQGKLGSINAAVDVCNAVSLHSGLPISLVDLDRAHPPLRVGLAEPDAEYVFNAAEQTIKFGGLVCLHDAEGPCANGVKDSQRTKTHEGTRRTLSLIWGTNALPGRTEQAVAWYRELLERLGAEVG